MTDIDCPVYVGERILRKTTTIEAVERSFTTEPKRRIKRGCHTVRERSLRYVSILRQKYNVFSEIPLEKAKRIFQDELDIWDRTSLKAYFGTQPGVSKRQIKRRAIYHNTGTISPKTIELEQTIPKREGYLERLGLISYEKRGNTWFMALKKEASVVPEIAKSNQSAYERQNSEVSNDNFSLAPIIQRRRRINHGGHVSERETEETTSRDTETGIKRRESVIGCERNQLSESNHEQAQNSKATWLTPAEETAVEERDRKRL